MARCFDFYLASAVQISFRTPNIRTERSVIFSYFPQLSRGKNADVSLLQVKLNAAYDVCKSVRVPQIFILQLVNSPN
jgi:hypothetical protein